MKAVKERVDRVVSRESEREEARVRMVEEKRKVILKDIEDYREVMREKIQGLEVEHQKALEEIERGVDEDMG